MFWTCLIVVIFAEPDSPSKYYWERDKETLFFNPGITLLPTATTHRLAPPFVNHFRSWRLCAFLAWLMWIYRYIITTRQWIVKGLDFLGTGFLQHRSTHHCVSIAFGFSEPGVLLLLFGRSNKILDELNPPQLQKPGLCAMSIRSDRLLPRSAKAVEQKKLATPLLLESSPRSHPLKIQRSRRKPLLRRVGRLLRWWKATIQLI